MNQKLTKYSLNFFRIHSNSHPGKFSIKAYMYITRQCKHYIELIFPVNFLQLAFNETDNLPSILSFQQSELTDIYVVQTHRDEISKSVSGSAKLWT